MSLPEDDPPPGVPEWVVTYGDMMSLLLTFFIMLVSLSELKNDEGSVRAMMDSIRESFGPSLGLSGVPGLSLQLNSAFPFIRSESARSEGGTDAGGANSKGRAGAHKSVQRINHGTEVTMGGPTLFARFSTELTPEHKAYLDIIRKVVENKPNRIVIRGHASPEPLPPPGSPDRQGLDPRVLDQFDLSFVRAEKVADYLVEQGIDRKRLLVTAAGDTEPRLLTREKDTQRLNRRVDVFLIDAYITQRTDDIPE